MFIVLKELSAMDLAGGFGDGKKAEILVELSQLFEIVRNLGEYKPLIAARVKPSRNMIFGLGRKFLSIRVVLNFDAAVWVVKDVDRSIIAFSRAS